MSGFPQIDDIARARGAATDRAPGGLRLARFRRAWDGTAAWVFPAAPMPAGRAAGAAWSIPAEASPDAAYWIAHAARQDLWRALRHLRGFWPVVRVEPCARGADVAAGGVLPGPLPADFAARIARLATPARARLWRDWAVAKTNDRKEG